MDDNELLELINNLFERKKFVSDLTDDQVIALVGGLDRLFTARVFNCVDASGKKDGEWLTLSALFDRVQHMLLNKK